jgi:hypothetical protein
MEEGPIGVLHNSQHIPPAYPRTVQTSHQRHHHRRARQLGRHRKLGVTFKPTKSLSCPSLRPWTKPLVHLGRTTSTSHKAPLHQNMNCKVGQGIASYNAKAEHDPFQIRNHSSMLKQTAEHWTIPAKLTNPSRQVSMRSSEGVLTGAKHARHTRLQHGTFPVLSVCTSSGGDLLEIWPARIYWGTLVKKLF